MRELKPQRLVVATILLLAWTGASLGAPTKIKWTEEVQLQDGRVIQLKRVEELGSSGFPVKRRGFRKSHEFCYAPMNIYWKSKPAYRPETFDIADGKAYAKVTLGDCFECRNHNYPETNAIYFLWAGNDWKQIDYAEYPKGLKLNLLMSPSIDDDGSRDARGLVSLTEKGKRDFGILTSLKAQGVSGLNESPFKKETCEKCKRERISGDPPSSQVFLPSDRKNCE